MTMMEMLYTNFIPRLNLHEIHFHDAVLSFGSTQLTVLWDAKVSPERRNELQRLLDAHGPQLRWHIAHLVRLRRSPKIVFQFDEARAAKRLLWEEAEACYR
eukprot:EG_transcript_66247